MDLVSNCFINDPVPSGVGPKFSCPVGQKYRQACRTPAKMQITDSEKLQHSRLVLLVPLAEEVPDRHIPAGNKVVGVESVLFAQRCDAAGVAVDVNGASDRVDHEYHACARLEPHLRLWFLWAS